MRAVIQRVSKAAVLVDGNAVGKTGKGLLVFLGVEDADAMEDIEWLCTKIISLRIFDDADGIDELGIFDEALGDARDETHDAHVGIDTGLKLFFLREGGLF